MAAVECVVENAILRGLPDCIEDTGGLFVTTPDDDPAYGDRFLAGCHKANLPAEEIGVAEALRLEPRLNPGIQRVHGAGRVDRRVEDRLVVRARRGRSRRAHPHLPPRDRPAPRGGAVTARACATS